MKTTLENIIKITVLRTQFGSHVIHDGLDLEVRRGEVLGIVGGSGSGKSVLLNTIIGLNRPAAGTIEVFGTKTNGLSVTAARALRSRWGGGVVSTRGAVLFFDCGGKHPGAPQGIYRSVARDAQRGDGTEDFDVRPTDGRL